MVQSQRGYDKVMTFTGLMRHPQDRKQMPCDAGKQRKSK